MKKTTLIIFIILLAISSAISSNKILLRFKFLKDAKILWHLKGNVKTAPNPTPSTFEMFTNSICEKTYKGGKQAICKFKIIKFLFNNSPINLPDKYMVFLMNNKGDILKRIKNTPLQYRTRMQFPEYPVGPGDIWNNEIHVRLQPYNYTIKAKVKFVKYLTYKGRKCVLLSTTGSNNNLIYGRTKMIAKSKSQYLYDYITGIYMQGKTKNTFYINEDNKLILRSTINMELSPKR